MEEINEDELILNELKGHFKELPSEIIELLYQENNKDISKTIDALIENVNLTNLYEKGDKKNEINENNNIEENDEDSDDDFFLFKDENKKGEENLDNNKIENREEKEKDKEKIDDNLLNFLIELAPFNTIEEIKQKMIHFNNDIDKVISSLLDESNSNIYEEEKDRGNKVNYENNNFNIKRPKYPKERRIRRKFDENKVLEFLEKNKNKHRIDLHGFKLAESMIIVKNKLEEMQNIVKITKSEKLLIIVTGRGKHSPGNKPVLRPNILRWLKRRNYNVIEKDPGALYVVLR